MSEISPLIIEICIHYYVSWAAYDPQRMNAPAVQDAHIFLVGKNLLSYSESDNKYFAIDDNREALGTYVAALCAVPLPELKWVIPEKQLSSQS